MARSRVSEIGTDSPALAPSRRESGGFSLVELLVVVAVLGILAAIAIPIFLAQRERAARTQVTAALKDTASFVHFAGLEREDYSSITIGELLEEGLRYSDSVELFLQSDVDSFCLLGTHEDHDIQLFFNSDAGRVSNSGGPGCPSALPNSPGGIDLEESPLDGPEEPGEGPGGTDGAEPGATPQEGTGNPSTCPRNKKKKC